MSGAVIIRRWGIAQYETVPPTAPISEALAHLIGEAGAEGLRRTLHASFDHAVGCAVSTAAALGWSVHDETGRLDDARLAYAVEEFRAVRTKRI